MEKVKTEVIVINDDDNDDGPECKLTNTKKKLLKKKKRKVERTINTSSNTETLVITQKVRKQKFECIINLTNICEHKQKKKHRVKQSSAKINAKEMVKVEKIVPNCLRKKCKGDVTRKYVNYFSRRHKEHESKESDKFPTRHKKQLERTQSDKSPKKHKKELERKQSDKSPKRHKQEFERKQSNKSPTRHKKELERKQSDKSPKREVTKSYETKELSYSCERSENKSKMSSKHKKRRVKLTQRKIHRHTRYLSPISSDSLSDILSECEEDIMSYEDISSDSITEIDTLIKRTKDRERKSSVNRSYDFEYNPALSSRSPRHNNISVAKVSKKHDEINDSQSFKKAQLNIYKCRNKTCVVKHRSRYYDCIKDNSNIQLPKTDKPSQFNECIVDIDSTSYEPTFMSTPKHEDNTEILDGSASDGGTVLTGEMDIVSFHSQGTLVLDTFYSPSHPTGSPNLIYDPYSPTMSPGFSYHEDVIEDTPLHYDLSPIISATPTDLISNSATLKEHKSYYVSDNRIIPIQLTPDVQNFTNLDILESNIKQVQSLKSKEVKVKHTTLKIDTVNNTNGTTNFEIKNVKSENTEVEVPEKWINESIFESANNHINIKEEISTDKINNNNITLKSYMLNMSKRTSINFEDDSLGIKKEE